MSLTKRVLASLAEARQAAREVKKAREAWEAGARKTWEAGARKTLLTAARKAEEAREAWRLSAAKEAAAEKAKKVTTAWKVREVKKAREVREVRLAWRVAAKKAYKARKAMEAKEKALSEAWQAWDVWDVWQANDTRINRYRSPFGRMKEAAKRVNSSTPTPSIFGLKLLYLFLPADKREHLPGDLEEEFSTIIFPEFGPRYAKFWFFWQVIRSILTTNKWIGWLVGMGGLGGLTASVSTILKRRFIGDSD